MAFVTLITEQNNVEIIVFSSIYNKIKEELVEGNFVLCKGKRDGNKLLLDKINKLTDVAELSTGKFEDAVPKATPTGTKWAEDESANVDVINGGLI